MSYPASAAFPGFLIDNTHTCRYNNPRKAGVAQLVEYKLPKLGVAGSNPVARSIIVHFHTAQIDPS
jgi:hypothetical protein